MAVTLGLIFVDVVLVVVEVAALSSSKRRRGGGGREGSRETEEEREVWTHRQRGKEEVGRRDTADNVLSHCSRFSLKTWYR